MLGVKDKGFEMVAILLNRLAEAYAAPRVSARRIIAAAPTFGEAFTMVLAGVALALAADFAFRMAFPHEVSVVAGADGDDATVGRVSGAELILSILLLSIAQYFLVTSLAWSVGPLGRRFGLARGRRRRRRVACSRSDASEYRHCGVADHRRGAGSKSWP